MFLEEIFLGGWRGCEAVTVRKGHGSMVSKAQKEKAYAVGRVSFLRISPYEYFHQLLRTRGRGRGREGGMVMICKAISFFGRDLSGRLEGVRSCHGAKGAWHQRPQKKESIRYGRSLCSEDFSLQVFLPAP